MDKKDNKYAVEILPDVGLRLGQLAIDNESGEMFVAQSVEQHLFNSSVLGLRMVIKLDGEVMATSDHRLDNKTSDLLTISTEWIRHYIEECNHGKRRDTIDHREYEHATQPLSQRITLSQALDMIKQQSEIIGRLTLDNNSLQDTYFKRQIWLKRRKQQAGWPDLASFDDVWDDTIKKARAYDLGVQDYTKIDMRLPMYAKVDNVTLCLWKKQGTDDVLEYYRHSGAWSVDYKIVDNMVMTVCPDIPSYHDKWILPITKKEYYEDNGLEYKLPSHE